MAIRNDLALFTARGGQLPDGEDDRLVRLTVTGGDRYAVTFDNATAQELIWTLPELPAGYQGQALKLEVMGIAEATSGNIGLSVAVEAVTPGDAVDLDSSVSFDTANSATGAVAATAGHLFLVTITLTNKDSAAAGDHLRLKVTRAADDSATGTFWLLGAKLFEDVSNVDLTAASSILLPPVQAASSSTVGLTVKGASGQSANLQEWKNNSDTVVGSISNVGSLAANYLAVTEYVNVFNGAINVGYGSCGLSPNGQVTGRWINLTNSTSNQIVATIKGASGQSVPLVQAVRHDDNHVFSLDNNGSMTLGIGYYITYSYNGDITATENLRLRVSNGNPIVARSKLEIGTTNELSSSAVPLLVKGNTSASVDLLQVFKGTTQQFGISSTGRVQLMGSSGMFDAMYYDGSNFSCRNFSTGNAYYGAASGGTWIQGGGSNILLVQSSGTTANVINAAHVPLICKGFASQSANLQQWQNSAGAVLAHVNKDGDFVDSTGLANRRRNHIGTVSSSTISFNCQNRFQSVVISGACTLSVSNAIDGPVCTLRISHAADNATITWPNTFMWVGGVEPSLSNTNGSVDQVTFQWDADLGSFICSAGVGFAAP